MMNAFLKDKEKAPKQEPAPKEENGLFDQPQPRTSEMEAPSNPLVKRESFALELRKSKKKEILNKKRSSLTAKKLKKTTVDIASVEGQAKLDELAVKTVAKDKSDLEKQKPDDLNNVEESKKVVKGGDKGGDGKDPGGTDDDDLVGKRCEDPVKETMTRVAKVGKEKVVVGGETGPVVAHTGKDNILPDTVAAQKGLIKPYVRFHVEHPEQYLKSLQQNDIQAQTHHMVDRKEWQVKVPMKDWVKGKAVLTEHYLRLPSKKY